MYRKDSGPNSSGQVVFTIKPRTGVSTLKLPIGTNNNPIAVREIVEPPPALESPSSPLGKQRYYNKPDTDMIILVRDNTNIVTSGIANFHGTVIPSNQFSLFLTNVSFFNKREGKTVKAIQINVGELLKWNNTNESLRGLVAGGYIRTVYVADQRTQTSSTESGVRVVNGRNILPNGLTIASPNPIYVQGHYNCPEPSHLGTTNTSKTLPASLVGDSITVLSEAWNDDNSNKALGSRLAAPTTVNAAFLAGIVQTVPGGPSTGYGYSGGVENFPRFLENWSGRAFNYNGSMVVMYDSKYATGKWMGTGGGGFDIYNPPTRVWTFDTNFRFAAKLPPGTPVLRALIRGEWVTMRPNTTAVN